MGTPFYDPFKGAGKVVKRTADKVVWMLETDEHQVFCTQSLVDPILEANQARLNESQGKRWGDGQIVASIPLDFYYDRIAPAKKAGDEAYVKRILNDGDFSKFRTFGGRV